MLAKSEPIGKNLDSMESWIVPTLDVSGGIQRTHDLLIPPNLHTVHNMYLLVFLSLLDFLLPLYNLSTAAIRNALTLEDTSLSSKIP